MKQQIVVASGLVGSDGMGGRWAAPTQRPLVLDVENHRAGRLVTHADGWRSGRAFAQTVRPDIVAVDLDLPQLAALDDVRRLTADRPTLEVLSGGEGGTRHLFVHEPDEASRHELRESITERAGSREPVRHPDVPIRLPGTPHRSGASRSTPMFPGQLLEMRSVLAPPLDQILGYLMPSTLELLENPERDRSAWDLRVCWRLFFEGWTDGQIIELALSGLLPFSAKAQEINRRSGIGQAIDYLLLGLDKIRSKSYRPERLIRNREDADQLIGEIRHLVNIADPQLLGGLKGKRVLLGSIDLFGAQYTVERPLAARTVAEHAAVDKDTANRWQQRLCELGLLAQTAAHRHGHATVYRLHTPGIRTLLESPGGHDNKSVPSSGLVSHPVFRHGYLNESGRLIYEALPASGKVTTAELRQAVSISDSSLFAAVKRLCSVGILKRVSRGLYEVVETTDLDLLAQQTGAADVARRQEQRHELDRIGWGQARLRKLAESTGQDNLLNDWEVIESDGIVNNLTGEDSTITELYRSIRGRGAGA